MTRKSAPARQNPHSQKRTIACYAFDGVMSLDITGPLQVFASANTELVRQGNQPAYDIVVFAEKAGPVQTSAGIRLHADMARADINPAGIDTILVPGGEGIDVVCRDAGILAWFEAAAGACGRLGSVCSGALLLAAAGLLDGRLATTHWSRCDEMRTSYPMIGLVENRLHTYDPTGLDGDGHIFTSAGVTAGIDLALALLEDDFGRALALAVARRLVMFLKRPGGQAQFSAYLTPAIGASAKLAELLEWLPANLQADLSLEAMAERAGMSPRTFSRVFTRDLGLSPARYVERMRVEAARGLLQGGDITINRVARLCGFGHPETMRRAFHRHLSISPQDYAERFGATLFAGASVPTG
ncbi:GlxA family transcriptional regulator [Thalassospira marina]|uniref:AraC family transcriptional regulator n=1 Tax=Thalassospira marina TaxID=2048283 RepID=A0ABN5FHR4_9PROT|nr:helix-turn-helix domain-containing protein [Thalassospira marina]AUG52777.1 AraC family transcriptional regulator [Thalassospira marina]